MNTLTTTWENIFGGTNFGDKRRNSRAIKVAKAVESTFTRSINATISEAAELKAAYRFMNNESITTENILDGFIANNKSIKVKHVLLTEDTSELNFAWRKKELEGLGPVSNGKDQGFFLHPGLMINPENRSVLGLAAAQFWVRIYLSQWA